MNINLPQIHQGKVRNVYQIDADHVLMVASDRISAFDVILPDIIPNKGILLTEISNYWFKKTASIINNHLTNIPVTEVISHADTDLQRRSIVVKKLTPIPIESIVRGYLIGSGWKDYQNTGAVCGIQLPNMMQQAQILPEPIFTPSTKAAVGDHDENISYDQATKLIGTELTKKIRDVSLKIYCKAAESAYQRGIIIADTKFEFGLDNEENLVLMDEILTPDSSRFWHKLTYTTGTSPDSYDKQFIRDYLEQLDWNKQPPGPKIPEHIIRQTAEKYHEAYRKITGKKFSIDSSST